MVSGSAAVVVEFSSVGRSAVSPVGGALAGEEAHAATIRTRASPREAPRPRARCFVPAELGLVHIAIRLIYRANVTPKLADRPGYWEDRCRRVELRPYLSLRWLPIRPRFCAGPSKSSGEGGDAFVAKRHEGPSVRSWGIA